MLPDDPFPDPEGLLIPPNSPVPSKAQLASLRVGDEEEIEEVGDAEAQDAIRRARDARAQALTLEMVGDLPFADVAPPENVLFVCKLNQVTKSEDLELIFSRFGTILSCEIICDQKTGDSLQYAFIEFQEREEAERAYIKMDKVLVDDRRIHVDFSQVGFSPFRITCFSFSSANFTSLSDFSLYQNFTIIGSSNEQAAEHLPINLPQIIVLVEIRHLLLLQDLKAEGEVIEN